MEINFTVIKSDIDETQRPGENPFRYAERLSQEKAAAVTDRVGTAAIVIAADTIVVVAADTIGVLGDSADGAILGKPTDADDARQMLRRLRASTHTVCTALTVVRLEKGVRHTRTALTLTQVTMRAYSDAEIDAYIATGDPFDKAGAYAIQHPEFAPVAAIDGSYSNVVGLPIETLRLLLAALDIA